MTHLAATRRFVSCALSALLVSIAGCGGGGGSAGGDERHLGRLRRTRSQAVRAGRGPPVVPVPRVAARHRRRRRIPDRRGPARSPDRDRARAAQGSVLQLPDDAQRGELAARRRTVHRLRVPHAHRSGQPPVRHRGLRVEPGRGRGTAAWRRDRRGGCGRRLRAGHPVAGRRQHDQRRARTRPRLGVRRGLRLLRNGTDARGHCSRSAPSRSIRSRASMARWCCRFRARPASVTSTCAPTSPRPTRSCATPSRSSVRSASTISSSTCGTTAADW